MLYQVRLDTRVLDYEGTQMSAILLNPTDRLLDGKKLLRSLA